MRQILKSKSDWNPVDQSYDTNPDEAFVKFVLKSGNLPIPFIFSYYEEIFVIPKSIMLYFHHHRCGAAVCVWGGSCAVIKIIKVLATAEFVLGIWWYWLDVMDVLHIYIYLQTAPLLSVRPSWKSRSLVHSKILTLIFPDFFVGFSKEHYRYQEGPYISLGSVRLLCACWIPKVWTSQRALSPVS